MLPEVLAELRSLTFYKTLQITFHETIQIQYKINYFDYKAKIIVYNLIIDDDLDPACQVILVKI